MCHLMNDAIIVMDSSTPVKANPTLWRKAVERCGVGNTPRLHECLPDGNHL